MLKESLDEAMSVALKELLEEAMGAALKEALDQSTQMETYPSLACS